MSATITVTAPLKPAESKWPWHPCPVCWGQGKLFERGGLMRDTESGATQRLYFGKECEHCFGQGEIPESFDV